MEMAIAAAIMSAKPTKSAIMCVAASNGVPADDFCGHVCVCVFVFIFVGVCVLVFPAFELCFLVSPIAFVKLHCIVAKAICQKLLPTFRRKRCYSGQF